MPANVYLKIAKMFIYVYIFMLYMLIYIGINLYIYFTHIYIHLIPFAKHFVKLVAKAFAEPRTSPRFAV